MLIYPWIILSRRILKLFVSKFDQFLRVFSFLSHSFIYAKTILPKPYYILYISTCFTLFIRDIKYNFDHETPISITYSSPMFISINVSNSISI